MPNANIQDSLNFLRKLSVPKLWNLLKVLTSFYLARWFKLNVQWGRPFNVSLEPTTNCNLGCPECPSGLKQFTRPTGRLNNETYNKVLTDLGNNLVYLYFYFQGEPYLHPQFLSLVKQASAKNIYTVTSTNAHFLTDRKAKETIESGLSRIIISIDGTDQTTYEQYRKGGSLSKVIEGAKRLVYWKQKLNAKNPFIIIQFLVVKPNQHQIEEAKELGKTIGVDKVVFKTAQIYDYKNGNDLIPTIDKYSRYKPTKKGTYKVKNALLNSCWKLWHSCVITWDGKVVPCCFDKDAQYEMGNINNNAFAEIWQNSKYRKFRKQLLQSRASIDICQNCTEGLSVFSD